MVLFRRKKVPGGFSLELVFDDVVEAFPSTLNASQIELPRATTGITNRLRNMVFAFRRRGAVNHVTGDVHYVVLAHRRRTSVLTIADVVGLERHTGLRRWILDVVWYRIPIWWSARVTVISEATRRAVVERYPWSESKIEVIGCPVSRVFQPAPIPGNDRPVVLQVGTGPNKNLDGVVLALARTGLGVELRIVGPLSAAQRAMLDRSGITWSSSADLTIEEIADEYRRCDLVVFASKFEGFGLPIVEAQASGRPVITSNLAPMSDVAGGAAVLVDPHDPSNIADAITRLLTDDAERARLVAAGLRNVRDLDPKLVAAAYRNVYTSIEPAVDSTGREDR